MSVSLSRMSKLNSLQRHTHSSTRTSSLACWSGGRRGGEQKKKEKKEKKSKKSFHECSRLVVKSLRFTVALFVFHIRTERSPIWVCARVCMCVLLFFFSKLRVDGINTKVLM